MKATRRMAPRKYARQHWADLMPEPLEPDGAISAKAAGRKYIDVGDDNIYRWTRLGHARVRRPTPKIGDAVLEERSLRHLLTATIFYATFLT